MRRRLTYFFRIYLFKENDNDMAKCLIATVIKNERDYLKDFIEYHLNLGVNEIHIYEDYGSDSHKDITDNYENAYLHSILDIYPENEREEYIQMRINDIPPQTKNINQILKYLYPTHKDYFVFLTDIDEFITCTEKFPDILDKYKDYESVLIYWRNFNCSGHLYKPIYDKPIWEIYTDIGKYEQYSDYKHFKITKFVVNMSKWKPEHKYFIHNAARNWVKVDFTYKRSEPVFAPLYLRHFITRSAEEWAWKVWCRKTFHTGHRCWKSLKEMDGEIYEKLKADKNFFPYFKKKYGVELPPLD